MWFIGVEVEQETSAPPPKKNPGSAPEVCTGLPYNLDYIEIRYCMKTRSLPQQTADRV